MLKRVLAILVLVLVAVVAIRLVVSVVSAVLWILVVAALVVAGLWARSTLKSAKRKRSVRRRSSPEVIAAPAEDPVAVEMRRITEQLREQGRR
jgi:beta-lactamase regulating signal transducer with metallopeptidase domain